MENTARCHTGLWLKNWAKFDSSDFWSFIMNFTSSILCKNAWATQVYCCQETILDEGRHHLLLLHKQTYDKRGIAESLHAYITRAWLTPCEVGVASFPGLPHFWFFGFHSMEEYYHSIECKPKNKNNTGEAWERETKVGVFSRDISQLLKICPPPSFGAT